MTVPAAARRINGAAPFPFLDHFLDSLLGMAIDQCEWRSIRCVSMRWSYRALAVDSGKRIGRRGMLFGAGLALSMAASNGPPAPSPPTDQAPMRSLAIYPPAAAAAAAPGSPGSPGSRQAPAVTYVGIIGDSTGTQLAKPLADRLNPRGVGVVNATAGGCQPTDVILTYQSPEYFERHRNCPIDARQRQNTMIAHFHPKAVVWADAMEWSDIKTEKGLVTAGSDAWQRLILNGWDRTLRRLGDVSVVLILPTWWAGYPTDTPPSFPVERQRRLFLGWAARHPGTVTAIDLGPVVCPAGPPCRQVVNGVRLRSDRVHYTPEGIRRVIVKIMADAAVLRDLGGPATASVPSK